MASNSVLKALKQGREEGYKAARVLALGYLEEKYLTSDIERNTPEADAILQLAHEVSQLLNKHIDIPNLPEET